MADLEEPELPQDPALKLASGSRPMSLQGVEIPAALDRGWVEDDLEMIHWVRGQFPISERRRDLSAEWVADAETPIALGWGAVLERLAKPAGYSKCSLDLLLVEDRIAEARLGCDFSDEIPAELFGSYREALGHGFDHSITAGGRRLATTRFRFATYASFRTVLTQRLGEPTSVKLPRDLNDQFRNLTDPFARLHVGTACYYSGRPAKGRTETLALIAARRVEALRNVLRGPNPEGRAYAYHALVALGELSSEDARIADELMKLGTVRTCSGCIIYSRPFEEVTRTKIFEDRR